MLHTQAHEDNSNKIDPPLPFRAGFKLTDLSFKYEGSYLDKSTCVRESAEKVILCRSVQPVMISFRCKAAAGACIALRRNEIIIKFAKGIKGNGVSIVSGRCSSWVE